MSNERIDFRSLDLYASTVRREGAVASILSASAPELARRAQAKSPMVAVTQWMTPALAAAALIAALSLTALWRIERPAAEVPLASVSEVLLPKPVSAWVSEDRPPSNSDLILAVEETQ